MSALAQFHALAGESVTGSDRELDRGGVPALKSKLEGMGIRLFKQDGSGIDAATSRLVVSGAIEPDNPEFAAAAEYETPAAHRADVLAEHVASRRTLAVAGTSGKSTATGMLFEILTGAGLSPSLIAGAPLVTLENKGMIGNAFAGKSDLLVIEADESDGTLPKYAPWIGLLLNLGRDHKEIDQLRGIFARFKERSKIFVVSADHANLAGFWDGARTFGFSAGELRGEALELFSDGSKFRVEGVDFELPVPGRHNAENALAAAAAAVAAGAGLADCAAALSIYRGVARRFEAVGTARGVAVVDDFAHNPDKVRAALAAGHLLADRVLAVFQPHGYGPTRFLKDDFIAAFREALGEKDVLWMPEIYYAGGTAVKNISSADLTGPIAESGRAARFVARRENIPALVAREAKDGDLVLILGARDPSLPEFARSVLAELAA